MPCRLLPEAEQAKHADTLFRYLFKVYMLSHTLHQPEEWAAPPHQMLFNPSWVVGKECAKRFVQAANQALCPEQPCSRTTYEKMCACTLQACQWSPSHGRLPQVNYTLASAPVDRLCLNLPQPLLYRRQVPSMCNQESGHALAGHTKAHTGAVLVRQDANSEQSAPGHSQLRYVLLLPSPTFSILHHQAKHLHSLT